MDKQKLLPGIVASIISGLIVAFLIRDARFDEPPRFEGEIREANNNFLDFILDNEGEIVDIDAYVSESDFNQFEHNDFLVNDFTLWNCSKTLKQGESIPSPLPWDDESASLHWLHNNCEGLGFHVVEQSRDKDARIYWHRGTLKIKGYFSIQVCDGPYAGGLMICALKPLNVQDAK